LLSETARCGSVEGISPVLADSVSPWSSSVSGNTFSRVNAPTTSRVRGTSGTGIDVCALVLARSSRNLDGRSYSELEAGEVGVGFNEVGASDEDLVKSTSGGDDNGEVGWVRNVGEGENGVSRECPGRRYGN